VRSIAQLTSEVNSMETMSTIRSASANEADGRAKSSEARE